MVKAIEFWKFICEEMDYRIFSGVPCLDLKPLYDKMSSKFMHYVPAVDEYTAFGISIGAITSGAKSGVLLDSNYLDVANDWMIFCAEHKEHILIITNRELEKKVSNIVFNGNYEKLRSFLTNKETTGKPAIVVLKEVS